MNDSERKWDPRFLALAAHVAAWSKDPDCQVGAVVVSPDRRRITPGYNGFPAWIADDYDGLSVEDKLARTVHAELNAILNARDVAGWTMYATKFPCGECAKAIVQSGVTRVVAPPIVEGSKWEEGQRFSLSMLARAGVSVTLLTPAIDTLALLLRILRWHVGVEGGGQLPAGISADLHRAFSLGL